MLLETDGKKILKVSGDKQHPTNLGRLCTKGSTSAMALRDSGRMESAFDVDGYLAKLRCRLLLRASIPFRAPPLFS